MSTPRLYLFISGCGRSGTSALTTLIGSHSKVAMGMERYGHIVSPDNFAITPQHFLPNRFLNVQPGETFYDDVLKFQGKWCPDLADKIVSCDIVGDKRPAYYLVFDKLRQQFNPVKFIHIIRSLREVASSWDKRAKIVKDWPAHRDFLKSVEAWNDANKCALEAVEDNFPILIVDYHKLFIEETESQIDRILSFLALQRDDSLDKMISRITKRSAQLVKQREQFMIDDESYEIISRKAEFNNFNALAAFS